MIKQYTPQYHIHNYLWIFSKKVFDFIFYSNIFLVQGEDYIARRRRQWLYCCNFVQNLHRRCLPNVQRVSIFCHVSYVGGDQVMSQQVIRQHVPHATKLSTLRLHSSSGTRAPLQHMSPPYCQNIYSSLSLTSSSLIKILMSIAKSWNSSCQMYVQ